MYAEYLHGLWDITAGYVTDPLWKVRLNKQVADWQYSHDCDGILCEQSRNQGITLSTYPTYGNSPFPQLADANKCFIPGWGAPVNAVPQTIVLETPGISIDQYTVGASNGPVAGSTTFTVPGLVGKSIDIALRVLLNFGTEYTFDSRTGTITLLGGKLFNAGPPAEVYTIFSY